MKSDWQQFDSKVVKGCRKPLLSPIIALYHICPKSGVKSGQYGVLVGQLIFIWCKCDRDGRIRLWEHTGTKQ